MTLHFGEKAALDAYRDFCKLQEGLITQLMGLVATLANPQVAFSIKPPQKTELQEDLEFLAKGRVDPAEVEELLKESGFYNSRVDSE